MKESCKLKKVKKGCQYAQILIQRRLPTETHRKLWHSFERDLDFRANLSMFLIMVMIGLRFFDDGGNLI